MNDRHISFRSGKPMRRVRYVCSALDCSRSLSDDALRVANENRVSGPSESAARLRSFLDGQPGAVRSSVFANAAAGLLVAGRVGTLAEGVRLVTETVDSGRAANHLRRWREMNRQAVPDLS